MFVMAKTGAIFIALCVGIFLIFTQGFRLVNPLLGLFTSVQIIPLLWVGAAILLVRNLYKKGSSS